MRSPLRWILWALALPWNLAAAWPALLLLRVLGLVRDLGTEPGGVLVATLTTRATGQLGVDGRPRRWRWSTTLGHAIGYQPRHRRPRGERPTGIQRHEHTHVRQAEDAALLAFLLALAVLFGAGTEHWPLALAIWATSYAHLLVGFVGAILRGGEPYRDAEHERSAYAQTDEIHAEDAGSSWSDVRDRERGRR